MNKPMFQVFECGGCGARHPLGWAGDCRVDSMRLYSDDLDEAYGPYGWEDVEEGYPVSNHQVAFMAAMIEAAERRAAQ